jgi:hypothetical protein
VYIIDYTWRPSSAVVHLGIVVVVGFTLMGSRYFFCGPPDQVTLNLIIAIFETCLYDCTRFVGNSQL